MFNLSPADSSISYTSTCQALLDAAKIAGIPVLRGSAGNVLGFQSS